MATVLAAFLTLFTMRMSRRSLFSGGEQRDEFAYLLGMNGFITEASILRESSRDYSYWSLSDWFTEHLLSTMLNDKEVLGRGVRVLGQLLEYSEKMASSSKAIVKLNAALLAKAGGSDTQAENFVDEARKCHSLTVKQRLKIDDRLKILSGSETKKFKQ